MNFFSRNDIGDRTGGTFRGNGYWLGQMGQAGSPRRSVIGRINASTDLLGDLYNRNAQLPLQYRVPGGIYQAVADMGDALFKKYVIPFNENPKSSFWEQPADEAMKNAEDVYTRQVFDFDTRVATQEKAYQAALQAGQGFEPEGPPAPEDTSYVPGVDQPKPANLMPVYIGLGVVALAAIVGAVLLSPASEAASGTVETLPSRPAPEGGAA